MTAAGSFFLSGNYLNIFNSRLAPYRLLNTYALSTFTKRPAVLSGGSAQPAGTISAIVNPFNSKICKGVLNSMIIVGFFVMGVSALSSC